DAFRRDVVDLQLERHPIGAAGATLDRRHHAELLAEEVRDLERSERTDAGERAKSGARRHLVHRGVSTPFEAMEARRKQAAGDVEDEGLAVLPDAEAPSVFAEQGWGGGVARMLRLFPLEIGAP